MRYVLSETASEDLIDILRYTTEFWGRKQAEAYVGKLRETMQRLARMPLMGRHCMSVGDMKIYRLSYGRHIIYYQLMAETAGIYVIGIDHQSKMPRDSGT